MANFVVLDIVEDTDTPIILGRPFLATAGAVVDVKNGKLTLRVGNDEITFDVTNPTNVPACNAIYKFDDLDDFEFEDDDLEDLDLYDTHGDSMLTQPY